MWFVSNDSTRWMFPKLLISVYLHTSIVPGNTFCGGTNLLSKTILKLNHLVLLIYIHKGQIRETKPAAGILLVFPKRVFCVFCSNQLPTKFRQFRYWLP